MLKIWWPQHFRIFYKSKKISDTSWGKSWIIVYLLNLLMIIFARNSMRNEYKVMRAIENLLPLFASLQLFQRFLPKQQDRKPFISWRPQLWCFSKNDVMLKLLLIGLHYCCYFYVMNLYHCLTFSITYTT